MSTKKTKKVVDKEAKKATMDANIKPEEVELEVYEYGDAVIYCHSCNKETPVNHSAFINVSEGVKYIPLTVNNKSHLTFSCGHCGAILTLHFVPSVNPPVKDTEIINEEVRNEDISKENTAESTV